MENTDTCSDPRGRYHQNQHDSLKPWKTSLQQSGRVLRVEGEVVQLVVHVDGVKLPEVHQLLQSLVDEDDADEGGEGLLGEARDVADQRAGVGGDQHEAEEGGPESDAGPQGQVGQTVVTEDRQHGTVRQ